MTVSICIKGHLFLSFGLPHIFMVAWGLTELTKSGLQTQGSLPQLTSQKLMACDSLDLGELHSILLWPLG